MPMNFQEVYFVLAFNLIATSVYAFMNAEIQSILTLMEKDNVQNIDNVFFKYYL